MEIVFRPHDESVKGEFAMDTKDRSNIFPGNIYPDSRSDKKKYVPMCAYITGLNKD